MKKKIDIAWNEEARIGVRIVRQAGPTVQFPETVSTNWGHIASNIAYVARPGQRLSAFRLGGPAS